MFRKHSHKMKLPLKYLKLFFIISLINCVPVKSYNFRSLNDLPINKKFYVIKNIQNEVMIVGMHRLDKNTLLNCAIFKEVPDNNIILTSSNYGKLTLENNRKSSCYKTGGLRALQDTISIITVNKTYKFIHTD